MSFRKKIKCFRKKLRRRLEETWLWDKLFLDFYLDKRWTVRFRLLNLLSGDVLLYEVVDAWRDLNHAFRYEDDPEISDETKLSYLKINAKHARRNLNKAMKRWTKEE